VELRQAELSRELITIVFACGLSMPGFDDGRAEQPLARCA